MSEGGCSGRVDSDTVPFYPPRPSLSRLSSSFIVLGGPAYSGTLSGVTTSHFSSKMSHVRESWRKGSVGMCGTMIFLFVPCHSRTTLNSPHFDAMFSRMCIVPWYRVRPLTGWSSRMPLSTNSTPSKLRSSEMSRVHFTRAMSVWSREGEIIQNEINAIQPKRIRQTPGTRTDIRRLFIIHPGQKESLILSIDFAPATALVMPPPRPLVRHMRVKRARKTERVKRDKRVKRDRSIFRAAKDSAAPFNPR